MNLRLIYIYTFLILCFCFASCNQDEKQSKSQNGEQTQFSLVSSNESGINFINKLTHNVHTEYNALRHQFFYRGAGVGIGDINNDGLNDIFFCSNMGQNKLYLNKGDFKFEDITTKAKISGNKWSTGVVFADVNLDGFNDIYVCQAGPEAGPGKRSNLLYINNGDLSFTESSKKFGLDDNGISRNAVFFDYDKDGDLDCYVLNESIYHRMPLNRIFTLIEDENNLRKCSSKLYRNENNQKFTEVTKEAGVLKYGFGLSANVSDLNEDGWLDIYVTNDYTPADFMYINQKDGTFKDEIKDRTRNISWAAMGMDIADINNDTKADIFTVEMASKDHFMDKTLMPSMSSSLFHRLIHQYGYQRQHKFNSLQLNNGNGTFSNIAGLSGLLRSEWSWSTLLSDLNNDGLKDCFITNGFRLYYTDNDSQNTLRSIKAKNGGRFPENQKDAFYNALPVVKSNNVVYKNNGNLEFKDAGKEWGLDMASFSNGAAYGDLDNDGDLDLLVNNIDEEAFVLRNNNVEQNNYLKVKLNSKLPKEGSKVIISANGVNQMLELSPSRGYLSCSDANLLFGLKKATIVESVQVIWPDGKTESLSEVPANTVLELDYKNALTSIAIKKEDKSALFSKLKIDDLFTHTENEFDDFRKEVLLPYKQSTLGPLLSKGDINDDGNEDFYVSGAKAQSGALFQQDNNGNFKSISGPWQDHKNMEDWGSLIFDANGDNLKDILVLSGGNNIQKDEAVDDRLYLNQGNGKFKFESNHLPKDLDNAFKAINIDIDLDGDQDLFLGGRLIPSFYPNVPNSYILLNDGNGKFTDVSEQWLGDHQKLGLINDIISLDINGDDKSDLIAVGEFTDVIILQNNGDHFETIHSNLFPKNNKGFYFSIAHADIDKDGDEDLIVGNIGLNSKFKTSEKKPFEIIVNDFDNNGSCDIVITKDYNGKKVPLRGRECSTEQMPFISDKFKTFSAFAKASVVDIYGEDKIKDAKVFNAHHFESAVFMNENGQFKKIPLPRIAQSFPIHEIYASDLNKDNHIDLILTGNLYDMEVETPRLDAGNGLVLMGKGNGHFDPLNALESGIFIDGQCKSMVRLKNKRNNDRFAFAPNNQAIEIYEMN